VIGRDACLEDTEALSTAGNELKQPELRHVPALDRGETSDRFRHRRGSDLPPLADQAHAERAVVADAGLGHFDVALLEDLQR
jgi:hypothetical protein